MKKLIVGIIALGAFANAHSNKAIEDKFNKGAAYFAGSIQESFVKSNQGGRSHDAVKRNYMDAIRNGVRDLEVMRDPNINEVHALINERLKDNDLSMTDYNLISRKINEHKAAIYRANSGHSNDVKNFRKSLSSGR